MLALGVLFSTEAKLQDGFGFFYSKDNGQSWNTNTQGLPEGIPVNEFLSFQNKTIAATNGKGLYITADGKNWQPIGEKLPGNVRALGSNGNTLFAAPWMAGIQVSFDQGKTWQERNFGLFDLEVLSITTYDKLVFAGTGSGLFVSWNDGSTWMKVLSDVQINDLVVHGSSIYAASPIGVFESNDGGKNWNNIMEGFEVRSLHSVKNRLYALTFRDGIQRKNIGDPSWESLNGGLPEQGHNSFALSVIGEHLWVGCKGNIYRLKAGASFWEKLHLPWGDGVPVSRIFETFTDTILVVLNGLC